MGWATATALCFAIIMLGVFALIGNADEGEPVARLAGLSSLDATGVLIWATAFLVAAVLLVLARRAER